MKLFKRNKPKKGYYKTFDLESYIVDFYYDETDAEACYIEIRTLKPNLEIKLNANHDAYGLLLAAAMDDDRDTIGAYVSLLAISATMLAIDVPFVGVVHDAFKDWGERKLEEALKEAEKIMPSDEEDAQMLMEEAARIAELPENEKKAYLRNIITKLSDKAEKENENENGNEEND